MKHGVKAEINGVPLVVNAELREYVTNHRRALQGAFEQFTVGKKIEPFFRKRRTES